MIDVRQRIIEIKNEIRKEYGPGWKRLSPEQQEGVIAMHILRIIMLQETPGYEKAQEAISKIQDAFK